MPRAPRFSPSSEQLRASVFARLAHKIRAIGRPVVPLHIGDTCLAPPDSGRFERATQGLPPEVYRYGHPYGADALIEAVVARVKTLNGLDWATRDCVQISNGATQAIDAFMRCILAPGDEVLLCAPFWPLIRGIVRANGGVPVEVPLYDAARDGPPARLVDRLEAALTPRATCLYFNTPNNPEGTVLTRSQIEALGAFAARHDLWILSDEAYEAFAYARPHVSIASLPGLAARTATAYTASKTFAMAGARVGWLVASPEVTDVVRRVSNHTVYNVAAPMQRAVFGALTDGDAWLAGARERYERSAALVVERLRARFSPPEGGVFVFLDLREPLCERPIWAFLDACLEAGVSLAPGEPFGEAYGQWARLCFTAVPEPELAEAIDTLNGVLARL